jgi:hypothetical protein
MKFTKEEVLDFCEKIIKIKKKYYFLLIGDIIKKIKA